MIHFHLHSHYSLRDGYQTVPEIVQRAKELKMPAIGLSDHGTGSGLLEFYHECTKANIKPLLGIEMYYSPNIGIKDRGLVYHLLVIAATTEGYHNLLKLNSISHTDNNFYFKPRISLEDLNKYKDGLIITSACRGGILRTDDAINVAKQFKDIFGGNFFIEIQTDSTDEQRKFNHKVIKIAKSLDISLIVQSDAHYSRQSDAEFHRKWIDREESYPVDDYYIMDQTDVEHRLKNMGISNDIIINAINNTHMIADMCNVDPKIKGNNYPIYPVENSYEYMINLCKLGWKQKILGKVPNDKLKVYKDRLREEVDILYKANYCNYMLIVWDMMNFCRERNIYVGFGRGSVTGSLVAYLLGITHVDPVLHGLVFQRFCHLERVTAGDIDTDIQSDRREEVIDYLRQKYHHVYNIRTFQFLSDRGALKRSGQALKIAPQELNKITSSINTLDDVQGHEELVNLARKFYGRLNAFSSHASAIMVYSRAPENFVSIEKQGDIHVSNTDYNIQEEMQLLKLDCLALECLTVISNTIKLINKPIDIYNIPLDDTKVYDMLSKGDTTFVFQLESPGMVSFCKQLKPTEFKDLTAILALYRPGALDSGLAQQYIDRKNGAKFEYLHPVMEEVLSDYYGVYIFQESIMKLVQRMANMTLGEADLFRRAIGKKDEKLMQQIIPEFIHRCKNNGIPEDVAETVANNIHLCSGYLFSLNHATGYAHMTYATAWLKCNYQLQFFCAMLNSKLNDQEKTIEYINYCKSKGIKILPPDINNSQNIHSIENNSIRIGFSYLKNVGNISINKNFTTFEQFVEINQHINKRMIESLIKAGCFDCINPNRAELLSILQPLKELNKRITQCEERMSHYQAVYESASTDKEKAKAMRQYDQWAKKLDEAKIENMETINFDPIAAEIEVLGFTFQEIPKVKTGVITRIFTKNDKNGKEMAWLTFDSPYGEFKATVFARQWKRWKPIVKQGNSYLFIVNDKNILEDLKKVE